MSANLFLDIIKIFSLEQTMVKKCAAPSCRSGYPKKYHKVSFSFEKFRNEEIVDSICQLQRLGTNETLYFMRASFWEEAHRSRWKVKFKMSDESHTNKTFQGAAKNVIIVTTNHLTYTKTSQRKIYLWWSDGHFRKERYCYQFSWFQWKLPPDGFQFKKSYDHALFCNIFDEETKFPKILESIMVNSVLHVQLQYNGIPAPLSQCFVQGCNASFKKVSMLQNLTAHIWNVAFHNYNETFRRIKQETIFKT